MATCRLLWATSTICLRRLRSAPGLRDLRPCFCSNCGFATPARTDLASTWSRSDSVADVDIPLLDVARDLGVHRGLFEGVDECRLPDRALDRPPLGLCESHYAASVRTAGAAAGRLAAAADSRRRLASTSSRATFRSSERIFMLSPGRDFCSLRAGSGRAARLFRCGSRSVLVEVTAFAVVGMQRRRQYLRLPMTIAKIGGNISSVPKVETSKPADRPRGPAEPPFGCPPPGPATSAPCRRSWRRPSSESAASARVAPCTAASAAARPCCQSRAVNVTSITELETETPMHMIVPMNDSILSVVPRQKQHQHHAAEHARAPRRSRSAPAARPGNRRSACTRITRTAIEQADRQRLEHLVHRRDLAAHFHAHAARRLAGLLASPRRPAWRPGPDLRPRRWPSR